MAGSAPPRRMPPGPWTPFPCLFPCAVAAASESGCCPALVCRHATLLLCCRAEAVPPSPCRRSRLSVARKRCHCHLAASHRGTNTHARGRAPLRPLLPPPFSHGRDTKHQACNCCAPRPLPCAAVLTPRRKVPQTQTATHMPPPPPGFFPSSPPSPTAER
eukprot:351509-Chlamydomonas_euryale.AAC.1